MFNLMTHRNVFSGNTFLEIVDANAECDVSSISKYLTDFSMEAIDLILKLLEKDVSKRPTA